MEALFHADNYTFSAHSVPFMVAAAAVLAVLLMVILTDGAPTLRGTLLVVCAGLLPYVGGLALVGSTTNPEVAELIIRIAVATVLFAGIGVFLFLLALANRLAHYRWLGLTAVASGLVFIYPVLGTDLVIDGIYKTPSGIYYFTVPWNGFAQLQPALIGLWVFLGVYLVWRCVREEPSASRRRQLKGSMIAFSICAFGLLDVPLAYKVGWYPVSWLFLTIGVLLALRLLLVDELIHARGLDKRVPLALLYMGVTGAAVWGAMYLLGDYAAPSVVALAVVLIYTGMRLITLLLRAAASAPRVATDTPLDRTLARYIRRVHSLRTEAEIAAATTEVLAIGLGCETVELFVPSTTDYSWTKSDGETLEERLTPDPVLQMWFLEYGKTIVRDDFDALRLGGLRPRLGALLRGHAAELLVPLINRDEVVGLLVIGALSGDRAVRREELEFVQRLKEHAAAALVYARMHREARKRVEVDKEVGLAAAVQTAFVPGSELMRVGDVSISGIYEPASKCGGDWWSVHELAGGRVLILIGDVTGHGIPAAMVTAAAKGCYDVAQRLMGDDIDLVRLLELLDTSVRRAGGRDFYMTCFATLIDARNQKVSFANAGHVVPYLCRQKPDGSIELDALVARGDPLGASTAPEYVALEREILKGDVLIWYTDGLVECTNPQRRQFGDRRMQRLLRQLDTRGVDVRGIRDHVVRTAVAFQEGHPADDDITLVVGRVA